MKTAVFLLALLFTANIGWSQRAPINFESGGQGANWTWTVFENSTNPAVEIITNPDASGANTSATVAKFTALSAGNPWAGCESSHGTADLGEFVLDATNSTIKIMVWKSVISDVGIKLVSSNGWAQPEIKVANTKTNQWEELTFDFSAYTNPPMAEGKLDQIVVFPDFNLGGRGQDNVIYFDNITFSAASSAPTEPAASAPAPPTRNAADVISLFSGAYANESVDTWRTSWSSCVLQDVTIQGDATKKYATLDFVGIETVSKPLDVTNMTHLHLDVWSANFTKFSIKLVSFGNDGLFGGGDDVEHQLDFNAPQKEQWVSYDLLLSDFTGLTNKKNIAQYILVAQPTGQATLFVDNMYFYKQAAAPEPQTAAPTPTRDAAKVISMFSDAYTNQTVDTWRTDWSSGVLTDINIQGNATKKYTLLDFVGIETVSKPLDVTGMTHLHLDVWSANFTKFSIKLVSFGNDGVFGGGDDVEHQVNIDTPQKEQWVALDLPLSDFTGLTNKKNIAQYILVAQPTGMATVFADNMYFYDSKPNSVKSVTANNEITLYPNPVKAGENVFMDETVNNFVLTDLTGKVISQGNQNVLNTTGLKNGVYLVQTTNKQGSLQTAKLLIF